MIRLTIRNGVRRGHVLEVEPDEVLVLGRDQDLGHLPDSRVSRRHARLRYKEAGWEIEDLDSTNGTTVNHRPVATTRPLEVGDLLKLGRVLILVDAITDAQPSRAAQPSPQPDSAVHFDRGDQPTVLPLPVPTGGGDEAEADEDEPWNAQSRLERSSHDSAGWQALREKQDDADGVEWRHVADAEVEPDTEPHADADAHDHTHAEEPPAPAAADPPEPDPPEPDPPETDATGTDPTEAEAHEDAEVGAEAVAGGRDAAQELALKEQAPEEQAPEEQAPKELAAEEVALEDLAAEELAAPDAATEDPAWKEPAPKEPAPEEPAPEAMASEDVVSQPPPARDAVPEEAAPPEPAAPEPAPREADADVPAAEAEEQSNEPVGEPPAARDRELSAPPAKIAPASNEASRNEPAQESASTSPASSIESIHSIHSIDHALAALELLSEAESLSEPNLEKSMPQKADAEAESQAESDAESPSESEEPARNVAAGSADETGKPDDATIEIADDAEPDTAWPATVAGVPDASEPDAAPDADEADTKSPAVSSDKKDKQDGDDTADAMNAADTKDADDRDTAAEAAAQASSQAASPASDAWRASEGDSSAAERASHRQAVATPKRWAMQFQGLLDTAPPADEADASEGESERESEGEKQTNATPRVAPDGRKPRRIGRIAAWAAIVVLLVSAFAAAFWAARHANLLPEAITGRGWVSEPQAAPDPSSGSASSGSASTGNASPATAAPPRDDSPGSVDTLERSPPDASPPGADRGSASPPESNPASRDRDKDRAGAALAPSSIRDAAEQPDAATDPSEAVASPTRTVPRPGADAPAPDGPRAAPGTDQAAPTQSVVTGIPEAADANTASDAPASPMDPSAQRGSPPASASTGDAQQDASPATRNAAMAAAAVEPPDVEVFLIDASGSMVETLPIAVRGIRKRIAEMPAGERVALLVFNHKSVTEPPSGNPVELTEVSRRELMDWLAKQPEEFRGWSDPQAAIDMALRHKPERVYLFSDDRFALAPDGKQRDVFESVLQRLEENGVAIHAVQLLYRRQQSYLERLAERTSGAYRFVEPIDADNAPSVGELLSR